MTDRRQTALALLAILALAALLRFTGLEVQSFWNDELSSWYRSHYGTLGEVLRFGVAPDVHPPGYQLLLYFVERGLGTTEWALRLPSALFGVLTVWLLFLLGRRLYGEREGLLAAALTTVLWCPLYYSQEARPYALLLLLSSASTYFWLGLLAASRDRQGVPWRSFVAYVVCASLAIYTHYFGLLLVGCQTLGSAVSVRWLGGSARTLGLAVLAIALAYLPWLPELWNDLRGGGGWMPSPPATAPWIYLKVFFNRSSGLAALALALYASLLLTSVRAARRDPAGAGAARLLRTSGAFLAAWLCLPAGIALAVSWGVSPVSTGQNLIICLPAAILLLARALLRLPLPASRVGAVATAAVGLILLHTLFALEYYWRPTKQQFREVTAWVAEQESVAPDAILIGNAHNPAYLDFYLERAGTALRVDLRGGSEASIPSIEQALIRRRPRYVWYVGAHVPPEPAFLAYLESRTRIVQARRFKGADALLLEPLASRGAARVGPERGDAPYAGSPTSVRPPAER